MANKKLMAFVLAGTLLTATGVSTAGASSNIVVPSAESSEGLSIESVKPLAVPAVVASAFLTGAAGAAGAKVGDWVADKIIGKWKYSDTINIDSKTDLDVIFD
ncbi:hypothetical protein bcgnr5378_31410 [Bacillus cereus]|nr:MULTISPECIES: hypothetical protein [Bacillus cereus group]KXY98058.1 hypothetical protein AT280_28050 [Bacillus cereus]BCC45045.1 hypothetical protein BCJMU02_0354 [Bacillus cereus]HDR4617049.1 hypothetical protein [Bacillus cereus]HDR4623036.1 hypothetical protein [Bacillus cereus]